jgi:predicted N-acetyltransferase YhbS
MPINELEIRPITPADVPALRSMIVARGFELPRPTERALYFVAVWNGLIMGGAGVAPLPGADHYTCELQHLRVRAGVRRRIVADALVRHCVSAAKQFLYVRCVLESDVHGQLGRRVIALRASARRWQDDVPARPTFDGVTACALLGASAT